MQQEGRKNSQPLKWQDQLQQQQWDPDLGEAMEAAAATMHGIRATEDPNTVPLGPPSLQRWSLRDLSNLLVRHWVSCYDVSLEFTMKVLSKKPPEAQQVEEWKKEVRACLESPMVKLRKYAEVS